MFRAADLGHAPSLKEVKFLLPKPVLGLREPRPPQWLALVQTSWGQAAGLSVSRAKHRVLQVLSSWPLFGKSYVLYYFLGKIIAKLWLTKASYKVKRVKSHRKCLKINNSLECF